MGGEDFVPTIEEVREDEEDGEDAEGLRTAEGLKETGNELFKGGEYEKSLVSCRNYYFGGGGLLTSQPLFSLPPRAHATKTNLPY